MTSAIRSKTKCVACLTLVPLVCLSLGSCRRRSGRTQLTWTEFKWASLQENGRRHERAALLVPVFINGVGGRNYYLQLDTAAEYSELYEVPYRQLLRINHKSDQLGMQAKVSGEIAGQTLHKVSLRVRPQFGDPLTDTNETPDVGTLGLDFFEDRVLLLDFPFNRLAILAADDSLPPELEGRATFLPATVQPGRFIVPVTINDVTYASGFFFDTGSSLMPILTSQMLWRDITKRQGNEPDNVMLTGKSWGQDKQWVAAPIQGALQIGPAYLLHPLAYYKIRDEDSYVGTDGRPGGIIGNVLFCDQFLVIVDIPHRRFGLVMHSQADFRQERK